MRGLLFLIEGGAPWGASGLRSFKKKIIGWKGALHDPPPTMENSESVFDQFWGLVLNGLTL